MDRPIWVGKRVIRLVNMFYVWQFTKLRNRFFGPSLLATLISQITNVVQANNTLLDGQVLRLVIEETMRNKSQTNTQFVQW